MATDMKANTSTACSTASENSGGLTGALTADIGRMTSSTAREYSKMPMDRCKKDGGKMEKFIHEGIKTIYCFDNLIGL